MSDMFFMGKRKKGPTVWGALLNALIGAGVNLVMFTWRMMKRAAHSLRTGKTSSGTG